MDEKHLFLTLSVDWRNIPKIPRYLHIRVGGMGRRIEVHMVEVEGNKTNPQIIIVQGRTCHSLWRSEVRSNRKAPQGGCNLRKILETCPYDASDVDTMWWYRNRP